jgi:hypothetical protein
MIRRSYLFKEKKRREEKRREERFGQKSRRTGSRSARESWPWNREAGESGRYESSRPDPAARARTCKGGNRKKTGGSRCKKRRSEPQKEEGEGEREISKSGSGDKGSGRGLVTDQRDATRSAPQQPDPPLLLPPDPSLLLLLARSSKSEALATGAPPRAPAAAAHLWLRGEMLFFFFFLGLGLGVGGREEAGDATTTRPAPAQMRAPSYRYRGLKTMTRGGHLDMARTSHTLLPFPVFVFGPGKNIHILPPLTYVYILDYVAFP